MIDIHSHILPGVDDGAPDFTHSIAMAQQAVKEGIKTMIATPHHLDGKYTNPGRLIRERVAELNQRIEEENVPVKILSGQEIRIFGELADELSGTELLTLGETGPYVLIELPSSQVPRYTEQLLFDIQLKGYIPVIAHPERNQEIIENPGQLYNLVKKGAYSQVTALSVAGGFGKKIQKFSLSLIEHNLSHFIASDAHNTRTRPFKMAQALDVIEKKFGSGMVYQLVENAELMVEGSMAYKEDPRKVRQKKILGIF
ncbi:tyrosine protein phosphatase [Bacillus salacetis]|uniref:Tyrosine-protein phosphatase n=1 Tax=Bacillus salacetis TaxID=2315464 RepID=A0A3A1R5P3_9BACI|nr:CpsB/CapC family capsule biosynthesis tyrosine phosphatase [Bacillus salacetis]RIW36062.1 tyrosine protein phosphatase [Bacillus salacetis]